MGSVLGELLLKAVTVQTVSHERLQRPVQPDKLSDTACRQVGQTSVLQAEVLDAAEGLVEGSPQTAGNEAQGQHDGDCQHQGYDTELEHDALHDVFLQVDGRKRMVPPHHLNHPYQVFGIKPPGEEVEQRRGKQQQPDDAADERHQHLLRQTLCPLRMQGFTLHAICILFHRRS